MIPAELVVGVGLALLAAAIWVTQPMTTWLDRRRAERAERAALLAFLTEVRLLPETNDGSPVFDTLVDEWGNW